MASVSFGKRRLGSLILKTLAFGSGPFVPSKRHGYEWAIYFTMNDFYMRLFRQAGDVEYVWKHQSLHVRLQVRVANKTRFAYYLESVRGIKVSFSNIKVEIQSVD